MEAESVPLLIEILGDGRMTSYLYVQTQARNTSHVFRVVNNMHIVVVAARD